MFLSFVIPTFNRDYCIGRAIDSVLNQSQLFSLGCEIIVVDDASTDSTSETLEKYRPHKMVTIVRFNSNRGPGAARNTGFENARGEWCALLDSDNALLPNMGKKIEGLLSTMSDGIGVVWAGSLDDDGKNLVTHGKTGRISGLDVLRGAFPGEHFPFVRTRIARSNPNPVLGMRHACEPAFWAAMAKVTDFWIEREAFQYYESGSRDRFCDINIRIAGAAQLATCYHYTSTIVGDISPKYYWQLKGKAALYRSVSGDWVGGVRESFASLLGVRYAWQNLLIALVCLTGPAVSRWLLRLRDGN